jgi:hypothetical protein
MDRVEDTVSKINCLCVHIHFREHVCTNPLPRNGLHNTVYSQWLYTLRYYSALCGALWSTGSHAAPDGCRFDGIDSAANRNEYQ